MKAHPDPVIASVKNSIAAKSNGQNKSTVKVASSNPSGSAKDAAQHKSVVLPMHRIEQARNLNAAIMKEMPLESEVKMQSVAM